MIFDEPVTLEGKETTQYGSMAETARRRLTEEEVLWNTKFIKQEAVEQRRGFALVATPSTPAPATPPWRTKRRVAADAAPMHVDSRQSGRSFRTKKKSQRLQQPLVLDQHRRLGSSRSPRPLLGSPTSIK